MTDKAAPRYVPLDDLRHMVAPKVGRDRFRALVRQLEKTAAFPKPDPLFEGYYWPSVEKWLDARNGLLKAGEAITAIDGAEKW